MNPSAILRMSAFLAITALLLFGGAGRFDVPFFWAFLGMFVVTSAVMMMTADPGLLRERTHPGSGGLDRKMPMFILPFFAAHLAVAGLDVRFGWSRVPAIWQCAGLVVCAAGYFVTVWALNVNRFYSPVIRIQAERGHHVVDRGPYAVIRHPGYACALVLLVSGGIMLGSWWSVLCNIVPMAFILRRVAIEDPFLHANLTGYKEYARRVRYRLVPGLW